ncbi:TetR family transcriptional regulator C-terminal domain-containing protein [Rhodobacter sp. NTK016B]|uniref:TetR family transcriptional regulator C-terminal domain-containing protein n=1 Tax=Rhodobacter sp. NTK016B TaxID=2759676 RepID=UPI001A902DE9|nr:TetR family transcriptional regulator C-terminal domain-containing protein [Rhodobacter sp. NTK016B]MBN8291650.1 TetR family transcriptional regulator C-terminal domain-containing protein [Rhodobacter sp. NTK016B]
MTTRIQRRNRRRILEAALDVFSAQGFRGATLDQIAGVAGLSKPNLLYYFDSKEAMHRALLDDLLDIWLAPLRAMNPDGNGREEILAYMRRKLQMSRELPRESRLFANEVLQGAPRLADQISGDLKRLVDDQAVVIRRWISMGQIAAVDPYHLIFSIWALTQHYADFDAQIRLIRDGADPMDGADGFLETLFDKLLQP